MGVSAPKRERDTLGFSVSFGETLGPTNTPIGILGLSVTTLGVM